MGANIAHAAHAWHIARIDTAQFALAVVFTSLFPLSIALVTHLLKRTIERTIKRAGAVTTLAELTRQAAEMTQEAAALTRQRDALTVQVDALKAEHDQAKRNRPAAVTDETRQQAYAILAERSAISGAELGRLLGKSDGLGRRLKREFEAEAEQQPEPLATRTNGNGKVTQ
jgi:hypothetical protein